jgi:cytochrome c6
MKAIRTILVLAVVVGFMCSSAAFAQNATADLYKSKCAMCHGPDGSKENAAMGVKPLTGADVQKMSDADLAAVISTGKGKMPAYKGKLTDDQIKDLAKYVHTLKK